MWSFLQLVLGSYLGPASRTIFALLGAIVFSPNNVLDTENLIAKHDLDDYVAASLSLYLVQLSKSAPKSESALTAGFWEATPALHSTVVDAPHNALEFRISSPGTLEWPVGGVSQPARCL